MVEKKTTYKKITGDDKTYNKATPVTNEELEKSIKKTTEETKIKTMPVNFIVPEPKKDISPESKETLRQIGAGEYSIPSHLLTKEQKEQPDIMDYNAELRNLSKQHDVLKEELEKHVAKRPSLQHVSELRRRDRHFNKTCAACGERKLLKNMQDGKAEECDNCRK